MDMNLQPQAATCFVSGEPFVEGDRVVSHLLRSESLEVMRYDVGAGLVKEFKAEGTPVCSWVHIYKVRSGNDNADRQLKLTAENLFLTLADPANEPTVENTRLVQFLALMLERKRILKPKGRNADGDKNVYEHAKSKELYEVPVGELDPAFFVAVQEQLSVLVGSPAERAPDPEKNAVPETVEEPAAS